MRCVLLAFVSLFGGPALANTVGCGENAFTHAEVVEGKPGASGKGPITSVPDSLCADLIEDRTPTIGSLNLQIGDPNGSAAPTSRGRGRRGGAPTGLD
jgi:hypothetical protein